MCDRSFVTKYLTPFPKHLARGLRHLEPIIRERKNTLDALGKDDPNLPVDLLTWMLTHSGGNVDRSSMEALTQQMLLVNFAAIQTSSVVRNLITISYLAEAEPLLGIWPRPFHSRGQPVICHLPPRRGRVSDPSTWMVEGVRREDVQAGLIPQRDHALQFRRPFVASFLLFLVAQPHSSPHNQ